MSHLVNSAASRHERTSLDAMTEAAEGLAGEGAPRSLPASAMVPSAEEEALRRLAAAEELSYIEEAASGDPQLEQLVQAVWDGCETRADIAEAIGLRPSQVYVLIRKLKRRVARLRKGETNGTPQ